MIDIFEKASEAIEKIHYEMFRGCKEEFEIVKKAITPPTAEEVCDEYFKTTKRHLRYIEKTKCFMSGELIVAIKVTNGIGIIGSQPPHLITLIGRFYEGVVK